MSPLGECPEVSMQSVQMNESRVWRDRQCDGSRDKTSREGNEGNKQALDTNTNASHTATPTDGFLAEERMLVRCSSSKGVAKGSAWEEYRLCDFLDPAAGERRLLSVSDPESCEFRGRSKSRLGLVYETGYAGSCIVGGGGAARGLSGWLKPWKRGIGSSGTGDTGTLDARRCLLEPTMPPSQPFLCFASLGEADHAETVAAS